MRRRCGYELKKNQEMKTEMKQDDRSGLHEPSMEDDPGNPELKRNRRFPRNGNLLLLACSTLVSLAVLEVGVRLLLPPLHSEEMKVFDAEIGKTLRPGYRGTELGVEIAINSHGLRSPETTLHKPEGTYRILVLGDSWTFGVGVPQEKAYPQQLDGVLKQRFPDRKTEVINAGVSGYETFNESVWFDRYGHKFEPDVVIIGFYPVNDIHDKKSKYERVAKDRAERPVWFFLRNFPENYLRTYQYADYLRSQIKRKARSWLYSRPVHDAGPEDLDDLYDVEWTSLYRDDFKGWLTAKESLGKIADLAAKTDCHVILAVFPDIRSLKHYRTSLRQEFYAKLERVALDFGIEVIDMAPCLYPYEGREDRISLFQTKGSTHLNSEGYRLMAEYLADRLTQVMQPRGNLAEQESVSPDFLR